MTATTEVRAGLCTEYRAYPNDDQARLLHATDMMALTRADFELTVRATVKVIGLGELEVDFDEGVPEPFPARAELTRDSASGNTYIRFYYSEEANHG